MLGLRSILSFLGFLTVVSATWLPGFAAALPRTTPTPMTDGSRIVYGKVDSMAWQISGILTKGCASSIISNCYGMYLSSNASDMLDSNHLDSPRQRNEWRFPTVSSNQSFSYSWKQWLDPSTGSSTKFFHLMQVFGLPENGPIVTLGTAKGSLKITDYTSTSCGASCPLTPLSNYLGIYTTHTISGKFGPSGNMKYTVVGPRGTVISYSRTGGLGAGDGYIKFGTYRATFTPGMTAVNSMVGDWITYV